jgi:hypothetical protein
MHAYLNGVEFTLIMGMKPIIVNRLSILGCIVMLLIDAFVYFLLAYHIDNLLILNYFNEFMQLVWSYIKVNCKKHFKQFKSKNDEISCNKESIDSNDIGMKETIYEPFDYELNKQLALR